jgi:hypothetical protein
MGRPLKVYSFPESKRRLPNTFLSRRKDYRLQRSTCLSIRQRTNIWHDVVLQRVASRSNIPVTQHQSSASAESHLCEDNRWMTILVPPTGARAKRRICMNETYWKVAERSRNAYLFRPATLICASSLRRTIRSQITTSFLTCGKCAKAVNQK